MQKVLTLLLVSSFALLPLAAQSQLPPPASGPVDYEKDVKPLLAQNCYSCHGPEVQQSGLRLDRRQNALRGGDYGPVIVPGKSADTSFIGDYDETAHDLAAKRGDTEVTRLLGGLPAKPSVCCHHRVPRVSDAVHPRRRVGGAGDDGEAELQLHSHRWLQLVPLPGPAVGRSGLRPEPRTPCAAGDSAAAGVDDVLARTADGPQRHSRARRLALCSATGKTSAQGLESVRRPRRRGSSRDVGDPDSQVPTRGTAWFPQR